MTRRRGLVRAAMSVVVPTMAAPPAPRFSVTPFGNSCERLYFEAEDMWSAHDGLARRWTALHYLLGLATVSLASVAGFGGLQDLLGPATAAYISLSAAVTAAIWTFLRTAEQQKQHTVLAASWDNLRADVVTLYSTTGGQLRPPGRERQRSQGLGLSSDRVQRMEIDTIPDDPKGWEDVVRTLEARAKVLRAGRVGQDPDG